GGQTGQSSKQGGAGGGEGGVNLAKIFTDSAGQIIQGAGGGFMRGIAAGPEAGKAPGAIQAGELSQEVSPAVARVSQSVSASQEIDMDADVESEDIGIEQTVLGEGKLGLQPQVSEISDTAQEGAGRVISQGATEQANAQVSAGGTVGGGIEARGRTSGTAGVKADIKTAISARAEEGVIEKEAGIEEKIKQAPGATVVSSGPANLGGTAQMGGAFSAVGGTASSGLNLGGGLTQEVGLRAQASAPQGQASALSQDDKTGLDIQGQTQTTSEQLETAQKLSQDDSQAKKAQAPDFAQGLSPDKGIKPLAQGKKPEEPKPEDESAKKGVLAPGEAKGKTAEAEGIKGKNLEAQSSAPLVEPKLPGKGEYQKELAAMKGRDRAIGEALGKGSKPLGAGAPIARPKISGGQETSRPPDRESGEGFGKEAPKPPSVPKDLPGAPQTELPGAEAQAPDSILPKGEGMPLAPGAPLGLGDKEYGKKPAEQEGQDFQDGRDSEPKTEDPAQLTPSPRPRQGAQAAASLAETEEAFAANQALDKVLLTGVVWVWGVAIPTFGLSVFLGAIVGDLVWLFKGWALNHIQRQSKLLSKFKDQNIQIELSRKVKLNIIAMNLVAVMLAFLILTLIASIIWGICNSKITYLARESVGLEPYCKSIEQSFVGKGLSYISTGTGEFQGSYNVPGSLLGTQKWTEAINTAAQKYNVDACVLRVVIQAESSGRENAVGCHCALGGRPQLCTPFQAQSSPLYNLNWQACGYDIGLTQVAIYPEGSTENYKKWCDPSTPSRFIAGACYTPTDLLNPLTALDITSKVFSDNLQKSNGDVSAAFAAYVGQSNYTQVFVEQRMALYNLCVQQR
ncbi:MAG: transglycosylase SLT domain-containing protein, partial [Patescibacteria group bacterium]